MGVTNLWTILAPVKQHKPLSSLRGQTIAVDLSIWVCENQCVKSMQGVVAKPYLRNLFFRVSYLTQLGVKLVFVIEGAAPQLKWQEMRRRQQALGRGRGGRAGRGGRSNFNARLRECCQLLDLLGIPYVHSRGEAEAMCAALDAAGLVDACITDDGDVFLYGARTVYKNFTMNNKDPHVESYCMAAIEQDLGISRESLVGVALLLGCDYLPGGVPGVGVDRVIKYLQSLKGVDILKRFLQWEKMTVGQCVSKIELFIRQKSLATQDFPQAQVIDEFLSTQEIVPKQAFTWRRPHIAKTQEYAETKMEWPPDYTTEKVLPLVTLWDLVHIADRTLKHVPYLKPSRIVKPRVRHGVPVYEVEWFKSVDDVNTNSEFYTTMEEQGLFTRAFPDLVLQHEEEMGMKKEKKKKGSKKSKKKEQTEDELGDLSSQMLLLELQGDKDAMDDKDSLQVKKELSTQGPIGDPCPIANCRQKPSRCIKDVDELDVRVKQKNKTSLWMSRNSHTVSERSDGQLDTKTKQVTGLAGVKLHKGSSLEFRGTLGTSDKHRPRGDTLDQDDSKISYKSNSSEDSDKPESDSDSDKENEEVFLSLSQRLQMRLGQSSKCRSSSGGFEQCLALKHNTKMKCTSEGGVNSMWSVKCVRTRNSNEKIVAEPNSGAFRSDNCFKKPNVSCNTGMKSDVLIHSQGRRKKANEITDLSQPVLSRDQPINGSTLNLTSDVNVDCQIDRKEPAYSGLRGTTNYKSSQPCSERKPCASSKHISLPVDSTGCGLKGSNAEGQDLSLTGTGPVTDLPQVLKSDVETSEGSNLRLTYPQVKNSPAVSDFTPDTLCENDFSHVAYMTEVHTPDINSRPGIPSVSGTSSVSFDSLSSEESAINRDYLDKSSSTHDNSNTHVPRHGMPASQINSSSSNTELLNESPHHSSVSPKPMKPFCLKSHLFQQTPSPLTGRERSTLYPLTPVTGSASGQAKVLLYQTPSPLFMVKPCISHSVDNRPAHTNQTILFQTPPTDSISAVNSTLQFGNFNMQASLLDDTLFNVTANSTTTGSSFVSHRTQDVGTLDEDHPPITRNVDTNEGSPEMSSSDSLCPPSCGWLTACDGRYDINLSFPLLSIDSMASIEKADVSGREDVASRGQLRGESSESHEIGKNKIDQGSLEKNAYTYCCVKHPIVANGSSEQETEIPNESSYVPGTRTEQNASSEMMFLGRAETDEQILNVNILSSQSQIPPCSQKTIPNRSKLSLRRKGNRCQSTLIQHEVLSCDLERSHALPTVSTTDGSVDSCTDDQTAGPDRIKCSTEDSVIDLCEDADSERENDENPDSEVLDGKPVCVPTNRFVSIDKVFPEALEGDRTFLQMLNEPPHRVRISSKQPLPNFYEDSDSDTVPDWETEIKGAEIRNSNGCSNVSRVSCASSSFSSEEDSAEGSSTATAPTESYSDGMNRTDGFVSISDNHDVGEADDMTMTESPASLSDRLKLRLSNNAQNALKALTTRRNFGLDVNVKPVRKT
ncbi:uncharacterized protein [Haliotis asinina]|uniref:uncharacterized protein n=1 Tax=Haliotis asinina TaxID=109174 RepID=UPI00353218E5